MIAEYELPEGNHAFESHGYSLGVDGEDMKLILADEAKTRAVRILFSRGELIELIRSLVSGNVIALDEIA
jgi:hypothetical protein